MRVTLTLLVSGKSALGLKTVDSRLETLHFLAAAILV
jgi:hypothetical protein